MTNFSTVAEVGLVIDGYSLMYKIAERLDWDYLNGGQYTKYPNLNFSLIPHPSSLIPHPSSLIPHPSSLIPHPSSLIPSHSPYNC